MISFSVFQGFAIGILVALVVSLFTYFLSHSPGKAVAVGALTAFIGMVVMTALVNVFENDTSDSAPAASAPADPGPDLDADGVPDAIDLCSDESGLSEREGCPEPSDRDKDRTPDATDLCDEEAGPEGAEGCPVPSDEDGDEIPDDIDRCLTIPASTEDGCPPQPRATNIETLINTGRAEWSTGIEVTELFVGGVQDPLGIQMQVGGYPGEVEIATNREYQSIRGRVGITSEPCSSGEWARVSIKDGDGRVLWPRGGEAAEVRNDAEPFKVRIDSLDKIVLYAEGPDVARATCGLSGTSVGWVKTRLISFD